MSRSVEDNASRAHEVTGYLVEARTSFDAALSDLEKALNVASHMGRNGELLRQLNITRTQLQTTQLWAASATQQVLSATEEHA
jgi:hypothetical protein